MSFTEDAPINTSVSEIGAETAPVLADGKMCFHSLPADSRIAVYSVAGIEVFAAVASGDYELELSKLPQGNYIVTVNRMSYNVYLK